MRRRRAMGWRACIGTADSPANPRSARMKAGASGPPSERSNAPKHPDAPSGHVANGFPLHPCGATGLTAAARNVTGK
jgi:hypothetical protein